MSATAARVKTLDSILTTVSCYPRNQQPQAFQRRAGLLRCRSTDEKSGLLFGVSSPAWIRSDLMLQNAKLRSNLQPRSRSVAVATGLGTFEPFLITLSCCAGAGGTHYNLRKCSKEKVSRPRTNPSRVRLNALSR